MVHNAVKIRYNTFKRQIREFNKVLWSRKKKSLAEIKIYYPIKIEKNLKATATYISVEYF